MTKPSPQQSIRRCHEDWLVLRLLPGLGATLAGRLLERHGSPAAILNSGGQVSRIPGMPRALAQTMASDTRLAKIRNRAQAIIGQLPELNISLCTLDDPHYPDRLRRIADPPLCLFFRGDLSCLARPTLAIIGSRSATPYGKRAGFQLARELAEHGLTIISGVALGIDAQGHLGALAAGGRTAGVLGCGLDVVYPRTHGDLYQNIARQGVLLSEYPPGTPPVGSHFPARNRIISGLAEGVMVVEATLKSGSLITAQLALDQNREVFAVPGRIDSSRSEGTHRLLQQGAHLVHHSDDILNELDLSRHHNRKTATADQAELSADEKLLLAALTVYPVDIDTIIQTSGLGAARTSQLLLQLELRGLIRQLPGQQYERLS